MYHRPRVLRAPGGIGQDGLMSRSKSSKRWLQEHHQDAYVQKAREQGQRSRAVFKLEQIQQKDKLLKPGQFVLDLGAAPGGWSEYARRLVGDKGRVVALDLLPMADDGGGALAKWFTMGDRDTYCSAGSFREWFAGLAEPKQVDVLPNADHFLSGREGEVSTAAAEFVGRYLAEHGRSDGIVGEPGNNGTV